MKNPNNTDTHRQCPICKEVKELKPEFFHRNNTKKWSKGFAAICSECASKRTKRDCELCPEKLDKRLKARQIVKPQLRLQRYSQRDIKKGLATNLTLGFIQESLESPCVYCGFPSTGLDRLDNKIGHLMSNCVSCCTECNIARMDNFTHEEMLILGKTIREIKLKRQ